MEDAEIVGTIGYAALGLGGLALAFLLLKAIADVIGEASTTILWTVAIIGGVAGMAVLPGARRPFGVFLLLMAGTAGVAVVFRALAESADSRGARVLLTMFVVLGLCGGLLVFAPS